MLCQKCGQRPATVFISQTVNNKTTQIHLCEECAGAQTALGGVSPFTVTLDPSSMLKDFFSTIFPGFPLAQGAEGAFAGGRAPAEEPSAQCPVCGYQFSLFKQTGRLGCPKCYESFSAMLEPVLATVHGNARHVEDTTPALQPPGPDTDVKKTDPTETDPALEELRRRLQRAIAQEQFEEAARLRDEIRKPRD